MTNTPWITGGELTSEFNDLTLLIDPETGGPSRVQLADATGVDLLTRVSLVDGGTEHRGPDGGLVYRDTRTVEPVRIADTQIRTSVGMTERHFDVPVELDHPDWSLTWRYTFRAAHPRIAIDLVIVAQSDQVILRNVHIDVTSRLGSGDAWTVHAPGNQIRRDLALEVEPRSDEIARPVADQAREDHIVADPRKLAPFSSDRHGRSGAFRIDPDHGFFEPSHVGACKPRQVGLRRREHGVVSVHEHLRLAAARIDRDHAFAPGLRRDLPPLVHTHHPPIPCACDTMRARAHDVWFIQREELQRPRRAADVVELDIGSITRRPAAARDARGQRKPRYTRRPATHIRMLPRR